MVNKLQKTLAIATLSLAGLAGCTRPTIEQHKDLTGDGIVDIIAKSMDGVVSYTCLFIGQKDSTFLRTIKITNDGVTYFQADDGTAYFLKDGVYQPADKKK